MWLVNTYLAAYTAKPAFILFMLLQIEINNYAHLSGLLISGLLIIAFSMRRSKLFIEEKTR